MPRGTEREIEPLKVTVLSGAPLLSFLSHPALHSCSITCCYVTDTLKHSALKQLAILSHTCANQAQGDGSQWGSLAVTVTWLPGLESPQDSTELHRQVDAIHSQDWQ